MSIAQKFIARVKSCEQEWLDFAAAENNNPDLLADDFDSAIKWSVADSVRAKLGLWIFEPATPAQSAIIDEVWLDFTEQGPSNLFPVDYLRGSVALVVKQEVSRHAA